VKDFSGKKADGSWREADSGWAMAVPAKTSRQANAPMYALDFICIAPFGLCRASMALLRDIRPHLISKGSRYACNTLLQ